MRYLCRSAPLIALAALFPCVAAAAGMQEDRNFRPEDIATQPLRDLNLHQDELHALLIDVAGDPYSSEGLTGCADIERAVTDLDLLLGPDIDLPAVERSDLQKGTNMAGNVAKSLVGGLIPFRGILRELTGANEERRRAERIVAAALIRRGFLKGMGEARDCQWPARPARDGDVFDPVARRLSRMESEGTDPSPDRPSKTAVAGTTFVSQPVVQPVD